MRAEIVKFLKEIALNPSMTYERRMAAIDLLIKMGEL